jgi:hypothetical protein
MSSGIQYPAPTYIPPLPVFNPLFFPQTFATTTTSGGGGGQTNIFPNGLTSGNIITLDGGTGGGGGTGLERRITGLSQIDWVDINSTTPTAITGYMTLDGTTLNIGSATASTGINVNLLGSTVSANGVAIATGGNVSNNIDNTFQSPATTQTFNNQGVLIDNSVLSFPNGGNILWGNGTSLLDFPNYNGTFPSNDSGKSGLALDWNQQPSNGEVDFFCYGQGGQGGFAFYAMTDTTAPTLITNLFPNGISFYKDIVSNNTFTGQNNFNTGYINLQNITGSFPSTPIGYSQFVSFNNAPWFSTTSGGGVQIATLTNLLTYAPINSPTFTGTPKSTTPSASDSSTNIATTAFVATSFAPKASPTFTGTPNAPTASTGTNTTQLATTAFVQNAISSSSIQIVSSIGVNRGDIPGFGTGTYWIVAPPASQPLSSYPTPPYGYSFNYSIYTNITPPTQLVTAGNTVSLQGNYTTSIGTGASQPFINSSGGNPYWGYVLSSPIVNQGALTDLYCDRNEPLTGNNNWYFFTSSTDSSLLGITLIMNIYVS